MNAYDKRKIELAILARRERRQRMRWINTRRRIVELSGDLRCRTRFTDRKNGLS